MWRTFNRGLYHIGTLFLNDTAHCVNGELYSLVIHNITKKHEINFSC
ncbi:Uncharacterised protein [Vibrio cholerae]|nr:Uncharacterised protein [Vibrio cholerae]